MFFDQSPIKRKAGASRPAKLSSAINYSLSAYEEMTDDELKAEAGGDLICDTECYADYWLCAFMSARTGKVLTFEITPATRFNAHKLAWVMTSFRIIGFNTLKYDMAMIFGAMAMSMDNAELMELSDKVVNENYRLANLEDDWGRKMVKVNNIDLIEVAPLKGSLKAYAARLMGKSLQDLPFEVGSQLGPNKARDVRHYCVNDLRNTLMLYNELQPQLESRSVLSKMYGLNLMSKSDAQIAEAVIVSEVTKLKNGRRPLRPVYADGKTVKYNVPDHIFFQTPMLQALLEKVRDSEFPLDTSGSPQNPASWKMKATGVATNFARKVKKKDKEKTGLVFNIGKATYTFGMGGLHSTESSKHHKSDKDFILKDRDVASFYPRIIINQKLYPSQMGPEFLVVYEGLVDQRLCAKAAKNSPVADGLKITINGGFGKFGSMYSTFYAPDLLLQVTLSGQLYLLMLIEAIEAMGIEVVSANTDGIVSKVPRAREAEFDALIVSWEKHTNFETEETIYDALYSRDVNNYIAFKPDGKHKGKGIFSDHWEGTKRNIFKLHKNPQTLVCTDAIVAFIKNGTPIEDTIRACKDITRFISVMNVKGGGVKDEVYLGKVVRWYYAEGERGNIIYKANSKKVPKSDGAKPIMELTDELPADLNREWYINETIDLLHDIDYYKKPELRSLF